MAELVLKMSVSVDGFVGTETGGVGWLFPSMCADATAWVVDTLWQAGGHAMGGVTYRDMAAYWPTSDHPVAAPMNAIPKLVFSSTVTGADWPVSTTLSGDLATEVRRLKRRPGKPIVAHGGAGFARSLCRLGLVDEFRLLTHPVVLGRGLPIFVEPAELELVSVTPFAGGAVAHVYRTAVAS